MQWHAKRFGHLSFIYFTKPECFPTIAGAPSVATPTILFHGIFDPIIKVSKASNMIAPGSAF